MRAIRSASASRALIIGALATFTLALAGTAAFSEGRPTAKSFEGVWKITKVVRTGANAGTDSHPQPGLQIFYRGYFSIVRDNSSEPRKRSPAVDTAAGATDAQKIARYEEWAPFGAAAGTYAVNGDKIFTRNIVAKQAGGGGVTEEATFKFEGPDTFVAIAKSPPGVPVGERLTTYTRLR